VFLIVRGATAAASTRKLLERPRKASAPDPLQRVMSDGDRQMLYAYTAAMTAGLIGWFVCALFASVAYSWTFYYLLALIVAARELAKARLTAARAIARTDRAVAVPVAAGQRRPAHGLAGTAITSLAQGRGLWR